MDYAHTCGGCWAMWAKRKKEPPCATCRTEPLEENRDALNVFLEVRYQLIMGMNGPVDLNHVAIDNSIGRRGITDRQKCFDKVLLIGRWWLERIREKKEE